MNLDQIETKCFILALFIRDDGERFLLGSRAYEFVDSQLHFVANSYQNDIVEVQGNDGVMLAGQVRRGTSQPFDGYIGDQTVDRATIEQYRRDFMKFFRKNHYYKVVYVFPDGSAVQRRNGFIVEAPEVKELYQLFPQYHISMNFEDINYYVYEEDSDGEEIYGESATLKIATSATGGLIWEEGTESEISGEGSQFTLQDTIDGNVLDSVQLKGDTTQQTYSGKNLVNLATFEKGRIDSGVIGYAADTSSITVSGDSLSFTTTKDNRGILSAIIAVSPSTAYTFSGVSTTVDYRYVDYYDNNGNWLSRQGGSSAFSDLTVTTPNNCYGIRLSFRLASAGTGTLTNIQFELGSTATSYEPYVGGIPAPNPDYPQPVQVVTGRQVVDVYDKNLLDTTKLESGVISSETGANIENVNRVRISSDGAISVTGGATYTISTSAELRVALYAYNDSTFITGWGGTWVPTSQMPYTFVVPSNATKIRVAFSFTDNRRMYVSDVTNPQFELGSSATPYQSHQSYEVNLGKNLFDYNSADQGYIGSSGQFISNQTAMTSTYIEVEPGAAYTASANITYRYIGICEYASDKTFIDKVQENVSSLTVTMSPTTRYIRVYYNQSTNVDVSTLITTQAQIEKGSATTYAPYFTPIELCKIGTYQDYIYKSGDDWYVHKAIGKKTFNGSENWVIGNTGTPNFYYVITSGIPDVIGGNVTTLYSNYGTGNNIGNSNTNIGIMIANPGMRVRYGTEMTSDAWKTKLSSTNLYVYYPLATATDTQITDSSLIAQLEALLGATTYDGQTVFTVSSANQLAILDVTVIARTGGGVVWDNYGAEWEEGTGGGPTMVNIDSIDNVYPVLTLTGPAVNPQISVLTTNTTLSYSGTVTSSQELKIDMFNKTATLNGASVVGNVSGDWVYLKPGVNRITYTTNNADAPDSTIWWQEIVG